MPLRPSGKTYGEDKVAAGVAVTVAFGVGANTSATGTSVGVGVWFSVSKGTDVGVAVG